MSTVAEISTFRERGKIRQTCLSNWVYSADIVLPVSSDGEKRTLELRLNAIPIDEDASLLDKLLLPITILLIDRRQEPNGQNHGYKDVYYYACDATFMRHGWRKFRFSGQRKIYEPEQYVFDGNPQKLFDEQDHIAYLTTHTKIHPSLEENPVIQRLKTATLWKDHY